MNRETEFAILSQLGLASSGPARAPEWIMVLPAGKIDANDGRTFINDHPDEIVAAFNASGIDLPVDFEHASETLRGTGQRYPIAGWVKELQVRDGALFARIAWSQLGREAIETGEHRYVSPAFRHTKDTRAARRLNSIALTGTPALSELPALASQQRKEPAMNLPKALLAALNLADDASTADAVAAVEAIKSAKPDPAKFVPFDQVQAMLSQQRANAATLAREDATRKVEKAIEEFKLPPALREWGLDMCMSKPQAFDTLIANTPRLIERTLTRDVPNADKARGTSDELAVCSQLGITLEELHKA